MCWLISGNQISVPVLQQSVSVAKTAMEEEDIMDDLVMFIDNSNSSFVASACNISEDFHPSLNIPVAINYVQGGIALVLGIIGFLLNAMILIMIIKYRSLKHRLMFIAVQIVIIELIYTFFIPPVILVSSIYREWIFGVPLCNIFGVINDGFAMLRFMMTLVLTLDRFISVFFPFTYLKHAKKMLAVMISIVYLLVFIRVILPLTGILSCYQYIPSNKICTAASSCSNACFGTVLFFIVLIIVFGSFVPLGLYVLLFWKAYRFKKKHTAHFNRDSKLTLSNSDKGQQTENQIELKTITIAVTDHDSFSRSSVVEEPASPDKCDNNVTIVPVMSAEVNQQDLTKSKRESKDFSSSGRKKSILSSKKFQHNVQVNVTMFMLLLSVIGSSAPAFTLYFIQFIVLEFLGAEEIGLFFIFVMLVGRTSFNAIPIVDALTIMRDREFRKSFARCCGKSAWSVATINAVRDDDDNDK
jgi:hypothetical protein